MIRQTFSTSSSFAARTGRIALLAGMLGSVAVGALAQPYKIVAPDGKVTYTDKPPAGGAVSQGNGGTTGGSVSNALPYETRQAASRYPVTLYASKACLGCDQARQYLRARGVPFREFSIDTNDDALQLQQRFGDTTVPVVTLGSQTVKGFSPTDMDGYVDAAGYPKQARLTGYTWPAATPLAPRSAPASTAATAVPATPGVALPPPSKNGIQF